MQRYKFESNSQLMMLRLVLLSVVFTYAKIQIWKQFTTYVQMVLVHLWLCLPMQRYKFESNSQPSHIHYVVDIGCVYLCKDTNLKAIHNLIVCKLLRKIVVFTYAKIQIWKQFTTGSSWWFFHPCCVYLCKDTNLKAIHNQIGSNPNRSSVVFTYAKIQIWKQFTTVRAHFLSA